MLELLHISHWESACKECFKKGDLVKKLKFAVIALDRRQQPAALKFVQQQQRQQQGFYSLPVLVVFCVFLCFFLQGQKHN